PTPWRNQRPPKSTPMTPRTSHIAFIPPPLASNYIGERQAVALLAIERALSLIIDSLRRPTRLHRVSAPTQSRLRCLANAVKDRAETINHQNKHDARNSP